MKDLQHETTLDLNRRAASLRNRRDAFSFGSRHADVFVQELAHVEAELSRRRAERPTYRPTAQNHSAILGNPTSTTDKD